MKWKQFKWILLIAAAIASYPIPLVPSTILVILCARELYKVNKQHKIIKKQNDDTKYNE